MASCSDSFELVDASSGELVKKFKRDKFSAMIKAVLGEGADLDTLVDKNSKTPPLYQTVERDSLEGQVRFDNDRLPSRTLLEVETEDRVGLLYKVSKVLHEQQLDLSYAKILTEKGAAIDSFYIKNHRGEKISAPSEQRRIKTALLKALKKDLFPDHCHENASTSCMDFGWADSFHGSVDQRAGGCPFRTG